MTLPLIGAVDRGFFASVWRLIKPYWNSEEKWIARGLLAVVICLNLINVFISVWYNSWNREFFDAIQQKNEPKFWHQLLLFCPLATSSIVVSVYAYSLRQSLVIRWRRWLTSRYLTNWLRGQVYYRMELAGRDTDNPDQRIQEDLRDFTQNTLLLGLDGLSSAVTLVSFLTILWNLSGSFSFTLWGISISIPGYMLWAAIVYAGAGSWLTNWVGKRLVRLNFDQQRYEADFRFSLVRLRENAEGIALYHGENDEEMRLRDRFTYVVGNWYSIIRMRKRLIWFTAFYNQLANVFPFIVASPRYFAGVTTLGALTQTADAFGNVQGSLSWFINSYSDLANWKAIADRLITFDNAMTGAAKTEVGISVGHAAESDLKIADVDLHLPDGKPLVAHISADIEPGERVLVSGPSGSGKSTLFRALAGIWPYGAGKIIIPQLKRLLFLPQRPYVPIGSLRNAVTFPAVPGKFSDTEIAEALAACKLGDYAGQLDESHHWDRRLSPGEQQRLALARAILQRPDWLFLDEATSALDPETETALYKLLLQRLPETTLVSIAHRNDLAAFHSRRLQFRPTPEGMKVASEPLG